MTFTQFKRKGRGRPFTSKAAKAAAALRDPANMVRGSREYYRRLAKLPRNLAKKRAKLVAETKRFE